MKKTKEQKQKTVGARLCPCPNNKGITLIALVITIIVMLILVAVTISMAIKGGLFGYAGKAAGDTQNAIDAEQQLGSGKVQIDGVWYDSIDDYLAGKPSSGEGTGEGGEDEPEEGLQMKLSMSGEKVTTVPLPSDDFEHVEGTIETGYVIRHKTDGNEFVWVPVDKNQKLSLKVTSGKDIKQIQVYDPYGDLKLDIADADVETAYTNANVPLTANGMYMAVVTTEDGITQETLTVRSLYALDTMNYWYCSEDYAITQGLPNKEEVLLALSGFEKIEDALNHFEAPTLDVAMSAFLSTDETNWKQYQDTEDYKAVVEKNGGFYIARYEAGATTARTSGNADDTVETIITAHGKPVSKEGYAPYNRINQIQALGLAKSMYTTNDSYEVSLLTGAAWDRTLGWIQETERKGVNEIAWAGGDSTNWGNYYNAEFEISKGKYSEDWGKTYTEVSGTYKKEADKSVLLTTGATTRNAVNNVYDLAGNVWEWTTESGSSSGRVGRGGEYCDNGSDYPAADRDDVSAEYILNYIGFRSALYVK